MRLNDQEKIKGIVSQKKRISNKAAHFFEKLMKELLIISNVNVKLTLEYLSSALEKHNDSEIKDILGKLETGEKKVTLIHGDW